MSSSELLCCICIQEYARHVVDIAPRTASTIYDGSALCWIHFARAAGIAYLLEIDIDDLVTPTGYSVLRKPKPVENKKKEKEKDS